MYSKEVTNPEGLVSLYDCNYMNCGISDVFWFIFSMVFMRGSSSRVGGQDRPGLTDDDIYEFITTEVAASVRGAIPKVLVY